MPPPIVPAPMTATFLIARIGVSAGTSGILVAARSAKKAWRSAFDSGVSISAMKSSRSSFMPSSNFIFVDAATASTHFERRREVLRDIAPTVLRANWK